MMKKVHITNNQSGQVILVLLLIMTVVLAVGLSITQRSVTDVATSTKVEESARAFSAAEAGIERAVRTGGSVTLSDSDLGNASIANVTGFDVPDSTTTAFEISAVRQENPGQLWLVSPTDLFSNRYAGSTLDILWGDPPIGTDKPPAIEVTVIYGPNGGPYNIDKRFYDPVTTRGNNFNPPSGCVPTVVTHLSPAPGKGFAACTSVPTNIYPSRMLVRARLIYTNLKDQPVAFRPAIGASIPIQGKLFISTGTSGETKRTIVLQTWKELPFFFDFVLFSIGKIDKP